MYEFYPKLVLRTPALGYRVYAEADVNQLVKERYFQAAILLASPALYWALQEKEFKYEELPQKVRFSLQKYLNRMCFRPTPFGLFSGFSTVGWGAGDQLPLLQKNKLKVHAGLGFSQTLQIARELLKNELAPCHTYTSNSSLYRVQDEYRYLRFKRDAAKGMRSFFVDSFGYQALLPSVLSFCKQGRTQKDIIDFIMQQTPATAEDSAVFFEQLVNAQVLVSTLQPSITGEDYLHRLVRLCNAPAVEIPGAGSIYAWQEALKVIPEISDIADRFPQIFSQGQSYTYAVKEKEPFYVNLEKGLVAGELSLGYQSSLLDGLHCLQLLLPAAKPQGLQNFIQAFNKKFENRSVPLLVALDPELGVGYEDLAAGLQTPKLLQDITFAPPGKARAVVDWTPAHALLLDKWQAAAKPSTVIQLTEQDLSILPQPGKAAALPPSISVLFRIIDEQVYLEQAGGVSATALLGRFTPLSPDIYTMAESIARQEEAVNPNVIFAEIAHLCNEHTANIDRRAAIRQYEIPVLVHSTLPLVQQIPLSDLWVRVENEQVILWSERLQKVIVPRLSSAFNYIRDELAAFRFLCDLQYQGLQGNFTLDLSSFFPNLSYYPRVAYKSAILHLATWHLKKEQLQAVLQAMAAAQPALLKQLADELGWPRHIALTQGDHQLVFDLERETDIAFFLEAVKNAATPVVIKEFPFAAERTPVVTDENRQPYIHQFLAALYHQQEVYPKYDLKTHTPSKAAEKKRKLLPGSEGLYFKLYCHPSRSNQLLTDVLLPVLNRLVKRGEVRQWFFVRYRDPDYHLRLRLCLSPGDTGNVLPAVSSKLSRLVQQGIVSDVQLATYERELERYGPDLIEAVEAVFCAGSALVAACLKKTPFDETEYGYYQVGFSGLDDILHAFGLDLKEKVQLLQQLYEGFYKEFGETKALKGTLSLKYREISRQTGMLPGATVPMKSRLQKLHTRHTASLQAIAQKTQTYPPARKAHLISDLMHLHLNRVLADQARKQELVVYYCLWKHYQSVLARLNADGFKPSGV